MTKSTIGEEKLPSEWFLDQPKMQVINSHGEWKHHPVTKALQRVLDIERKFLEARLDASVTENGVNADTVRAVAAQLVTINKVQGVIDNAKELVTKSKL